jgi:hypothetical protein
MRDQRHLCAHLSAQSMLDWYFDAEGSNFSLCSLTTERAAAAAADSHREPPEAARANAKPNGVKAGGQAAAATDSVADAPGPKPQRVEDVRHKRLYSDFHKCTNSFRQLINKLAATSHATRHPDDYVWSRSNDFSIDSSFVHDPSKQEESNVWLGLGPLDDAFGYIMPVAIKKNPENAEVEQRLMRVMKRLKPGSFIASANQLHLCPFYDQREALSPAHAHGGLRRQVGNL